MGVDSGLPDFRGNQGFWQAYPVEIGAGTAIPSVRDFSQCMSEEYGARIIRINPREPWAFGKRSASLPFGALDGLRRIRTLLVERGFLPPDMMLQSE